MVTILDPLFPPKYRGRRKTRIPKRRKRHKPFPNEQFPYKSEAQFQMDVVKYLEKNLCSDVVWTAFPAGGGGRNRGAIMKAMGLRPGWPDIILIKDGRFYGLELKTPIGRLSPAQEAFKAARAVAGKCATCKSLIEVQSALIEFGLCKYRGDVKIIGVGV